MSWHEKKARSDSETSASTIQITKEGAKGLVRQYEGPFPIVKKVGKVSYQLQLPAKCLPR